MTAADRMAALRVRDAGDSAVVMEIGAPGGRQAEGPDSSINAHAIAIARAVRERRFRGVRDVVAAFHSVGVFFDPLAADVDAIVFEAEAALAHPVTASSSGPLVEIPVVYGGDAGPDLGAVASFAGCPAEDVISRHSGRVYRVFMLGFLPGFPYMAAVDSTIAAPRRPTPRLRVAAGSVGIAGRQTGIYPRDSPGGWHIIGRTPLNLFNASLPSPAALSAGDSVRFVPVKNEASAREWSSGIVRVHTDTANADGPASARQVTVLQPGMLTTVQDGGRWGYQHLGVSVSGAMDVAAHRLANTLVGNDSSAATLEATMLGPELRFEQRSRIAVTGADLTATLEGAAVPLNHVVDCPPGGVLRFGPRKTGARVYIGVDGGIDVPPVLGSRATHLTSSLGGFQGRALKAGDRLACGRPGDGSPSIRIHPRARVDVGQAGARRLRVLPGPHAHLLDSAALERLQTSRFTVSPQSDRMGYRLATDSPLVTGDTGEMLSEPTVMGAVQVPPSGQPILLMADRQTTGGYPQVAVVISADLPVAAQLSPGDRVEFELCSRAAALSALREDPGLHDGR